MKGFKEFILRGNVVDLAVAFVIGAVFATVVTAFVADFITPLIGAIGGTADLSHKTFTINDSKFLYGDFIDKLLQFLIVAVVVYFFVVRPLTKLIDRLMPKRRSAAGAIPVPRRPRRA